VDYILPYWMARYYGVLSGFKVQSAAAATPAIALDSLASSDLADVTASVGSRTTSRGGISVRITDRNGIEELGQLFYVSPTQVNFLVPITAPMGPARITVVKADGGVKTAPALLTMNSHVAAATAVRIQKRNPDERSGIPLQCDRMRGDAN
jgi:uncharacterized protein (TIGR03437 family)